VAEVAGLSLRAAIFSERPRRQGFAAPRQSGASLTAAGRSEPCSARRECWEDEGLLTVCMVACSPSLPRFDGVRKSCMQDRELYRRILGIEAPWQVDRVELKLESGEVHIYLEHAPNVTWLCPECSAPSPLHDHRPERCWRHLDTCQYQTILHGSRHVRSARNTGSR